MTPDDALFLITLFLGLLTFAGYAAKHWPREFPGGEWAEEERRQS